MDDGQLLLEFQDAIHEDDGERMTTYTFFTVIALNALTQLAG